MYKRQLLHHEANPDVTNKYGNTSLFIATEYNNNEAIELLLQKGGNPNISDNQGYTPLHIAVEEDKPIIINMLLKGGAKLNIPNKEGITPYQLAFKKGNREIIQLFREIERTLPTYRKKITPPPSLSPPRYNPYPLQPESPPPKYEKMKKRVAGLKKKK